MVSNHRPSACEADALPLSYETEWGVERGRTLARVQDPVRICLDPRVREPPHPYRRGMLRAVLIAALVTGPWVCAPVASADLSGFTSPSGNIGCITADDGVRCDIQERDWSPPPRPADCPSETGYGQGIDLPVSGLPEFVCAGDTTLNSGPVLPYGHSTSAAGLTCASSPAGMTCTNRDSHGFTISRQAYRLF